MRNLLYQLLNKEFTGILNQKKPRGFRWEEIPGKESKETNRIKKTEIFHQYHFVNRL